MIFGAGSLKHIVSGDLIGQSQLFFNIHRERLYAAQPRLAHMYDSKIALIHCWCFYCSSWIVVYEVPRVLLRCSTPSFYPYFGQPTTPHNL